MDACRYQGNYKMRRRVPSGRIQFFPYGGVNGKINWFGLEPVNVEANSTIFRASPSKGNILYVYQFSI
jgi:hypothetical protein